MNLDEILRKRLSRLERILARTSRVFGSEIQKLETAYLDAMAAWEKEKKERLEGFAVEEARIKGRSEQAGREYTQKKYVLERDIGVNKLAIKELDEDYEDVQKKFTAELQRLQEE